MGQWKSIELACAILGIIGFIISVLNLFEINLIDICESLFWEIEDIWEDEFVSRIQKRRGRRR